MKPTFDIAAPPVASLPLRGPRIRALGVRQIQCVLARNNVARIAFRGEHRVELIPVHYVYADNVLYGRTSVGAKDPVWQRGCEVVVEIDEIGGLFDWRSVILRGQLCILRKRGPKSESIAYGNAVAAIRSLIPAAFSERDPLPYRSVIFRVTPEEATGREAVAR